MAGDNSRKEQSALSGAASAAGTARGAIKTGKAIAGAAKGAAAGPYGMLAAGLWENMNIIPLGSHQFPASEPPGNFFLESHLRHKI